MITSLCDACYISEYVYLHIFCVKFLLKKHLSRSHRISSPAHHLERTDNKTFSRLIGQTYIASRTIPIKTGLRDASLEFCNLAKTFKHNTICDSNGIETHNHLVRKRTLDHFAKPVKWMTCVVSAYLYGIHLNFGYRTCFEKGVSWNSGNYRVYIHSVMSTW